MSVRIIVGDALTKLRELPDQSVRCCVTSPPYFGLRDYGVVGQMGMEPTPAEYCAAMVGVFAEVRRVLASDGTLWLNVGDSYAAHPGQRKETDKAGEKQMTKRGSTSSPSRSVGGLKAKDLIGIPWMLAFALRADGWYLRSDIIWSKPNPMPESVTDRPTKAHEYVFLLSKSERYYFDADAIAEPLTQTSIDRLSQPNIDAQHGSERVPGKTNGTMKAVSKYKDSDGELTDQRNRTKDGISGDKYLGTLAVMVAKGTRNARTVWEIATQPYKEAHFATFPPELPHRCISAGSAKGDTILDPFGGAGTTGLVADRLGRNAILIELNPKYAKLAEDRITNDGPLFSKVTA